MALNSPLNERQVDVLRWIGDGCPDGRWTDFTFKTTATALASRRLVTVSKRGGTWSAAILPAGEHYLANSVYPQRHWERRRHPQQDTVHLRVRGLAEARRPVADSPGGTVTQVAKKSAPSEELTPTRQLLKRIVDAGGILELDTKDDSTSYRSLVGIVNRRGMAPDGHEVLIVPGRSYHHIVLRLASVSGWQTDSPTAVVAAERIGRWHPAVATLRDEKRLDSIAKELRGKAFRLLHALAREGEARGYGVRVVPRNRRSYGHSSQLTGDLLFTIEDIECSVSIWQLNERVDHVPTKEEVERQKKYDWPPHRYDYIPSNRLRIAIDTTSRFSSKQAWTETKTVPLLVRIPDVIKTFQRWAIIDAEGREAERRKEIERQARQAHEDQQARHAYIQHTLGERLISDAANWELAGRLRRYLAEMSTRVETLEDGEDESSAAEWLGWCENYAAQLDPLWQPIRTPAVSEPGYAELQEFRKRLGFTTRYW